MLTGHQPAVRYSRSSNTILLYVLYRNAMHDCASIRNKNWFIQFLLVWAGIITRLEKYSCFCEADEDKKFRPDVSFFNVPGTKKKC